MSSANELNSASTDVSSRKPHKLVPFALLAFGSSAIVIPIILFRRARARAASDLLHAPPRRASQGAVTLRAIQPQPQRVGVLSDEQSAGPKVHDLLYAFKALGLATCLVGASAATGVWAVRWSLGIQTTAEFAERMRTQVPSLAPVLSTRMHRTPTPEDSGAAESTGISDAENEILLEGVRTWEAAAQRLSRAYEEGGFLSWAKAAKEEIEREARMERRR